MDTDDELRFDQGPRSPARLRRQLSRLLGLTAALTHRLAAEALRDVGAHRDHFVLLAALDEFGPASQATLSASTRVHASDLVSVLNDLEAGGWVQRGPDPSDRRRNVVTITDAGARRLAELDAVLTDVNERVMAPLDAGERAQLFALLGRVNAHLAR